MAKNNISGVDSSSVSPMSSTKESDVRVPIDAANTHTYSLNAALRSDLAEISTAPIGPMSQLGPYQIIEKLGEGGMGSVYKARHLKLDKLVAIKILSPQILSRPDAIPRFEREMKAVGKLSHPNVVQAFDAGDFNGVYFISMEYVEGVDLQALIANDGPMSVVNACKAIREAALGLAAAHTMGLVHRDVKPSNLLYSRKLGQTKLLDMGLALLSQENASIALTSAGQWFGTPDYMAPEQWVDAHTCDGRADLYSLGCTLFFLLTGHPPYCNSTHPSVPNKMNGHMMDDVPDLRSARFDIPDSLNTIYQKLMAKTRDARFASADELAEELAPFTRDGRTQSISHDEGIGMGDHPQVEPAGIDAPHCYAIRYNGIKTDVDSSTTSTFLQSHSASYPHNQVVPFLIQWKKYLAFAAGITAVTIMIGVYKCFTTSWTAREVGTPASDKLSEVFTNRLGMQFILVRKGTAWLGGGRGAHQEQVEMPEDFYLGRYEVTQGEWEKVMGQVPSHFSRTGAGRDALNGISDSDLERFPVENVSWDDAQLFLDRLNKQDPSAAWYYRLPKMNEWEYACRGGPLSNQQSSDFDFYIEKPTNELFPSQANFAPEAGKGLQRTCQVGSYSPNPLGLFDMHGNVWEWCHEILPHDGSEFWIKQGGRWVVRGGAWTHDAVMCRAGGDFLTGHASTNNAQGLRVARVPVGSVP